MHITEHLKLAKEVVGGIKNVFQFPQTIKTTQ